MRASTQNKGSNVKERTKPRSKVRKEAKKLVNQVKSSLALQ